MEARNTVKLPAMHKEVSLPYITKNYFIQISIVPKLTSPGLKVLVALKEVLQDKKVKRPG